MFFRPGALRTESPLVKNSAYTSTFIAESSLFKSSPDPAMFGNSPNPSRDSPQGKYWTHHNWLLSRFHFSFAEYSDYNRMGFSNMRVMNDDLVQPMKMFSTHSHREANIATYVVDGVLTHTDDIKGGRKETLERGSIQYIAAGTGISHSEGNDDATRPLRFVQMWFNPHRRGLKPDYGQLKNPDPTLRANKWFWMISDSEAAQPANTPIKVPTDMNLYNAEFNGESGVNLEFPVAAGRCIYVLAVEGDKIEATVKKVGGDNSLTHTQLLSRHDAMTVSVTENCVVNFKTTSDTANKGLLLLLEMPNKN